MYLTKVKMELREALPLLRDCQKMHQFVTGLFQTDRKTSNIQYRTHIARSIFSLYIYSDNPVKVAPSYCSFEQVDLTETLDNIKNNQILGLDIIAIPCKKTAINGQKNSQRRVLRTADERMEWLRRKSDGAGFNILVAHELGSVRTSGRHRIDKGGDMCLDAYHYQCTILITDASAFRQTILRGIGPGKAYGMGMMLLKAL